MVDRLPNIEGKDTFLAYSGTTLENLLTCGVQEKEVIVFDKDLEPRHKEKKLWCSPDIVMAANHACFRAIELVHTPVIVAGRIPNELWRDYRIALEEGMTFPVERLWIPKDDRNWRRFQKIPYWSGITEQHVIRVFKETIPDVILKSGKVI